MTGFSDLIMVWQRWRENDNLRGCDRHFQITGDPGATS